MASIALPPWHSLWTACIDRDHDCIAVRDRLRPTSRTEERTPSGRVEMIREREHYDLPEGTLAVVASAGGRAPERAVLVREGVCVPLSLAEAEDVLDPAGAGRRAWKGKILRSGLPRRLMRFRFGPGHGWEAGVVYDWHGEDHVAACTRAGRTYVWIRPLTFEEAVELGVA